MNPNRSILAALLLSSLPAGLTEQKQMAAETGVLPSQKVVQVRLEQGSKVLSAAEVTTALAGAIAAWNAALPTDLKMVQAPNGAPPVGEVVFLIRFDSDPSHFGTSGIDEIGDTRGIITRAQNTAVVAVFLVDKPGTFSTTGAPNTHDLQLVLTHELGHALGVAHAGGSGSVPPIMAAALDPDGQLLARTRQTLPVLRQLTAEDKRLLGVAMANRKMRDLAGSYSGSLKIDALANGTGALVGSSLPVRPGEFVVSYAAGKVVVVYKGQRAETPLVDLFADSTKVVFPDVAETGRTLVSLTILRGKDNVELLVRPVLEVGRARYKASGTLIRN